MSGETDELAPRVDGEFEGVNPFEEPEEAIVIGSGFRAEMTNMRCWLPVHQTLEATQSLQWEDDARTVCVASGTALFCPTTNLPKTKKGEEKRMNSFDRIVLDKLAKSRGRENWEELMSDMITHNACLLFEDVEEAAELARLEIQEKIKELSHKNNTIITLENGKRFTENMPAEKKSGVLLACDWLSCFLQEGEKK